MANLFHRQSAQSGNGADPPPRPKPDTPIPEPDGPDELVADLLSSAFVKKRP